MKQVVVAIFAHPDDEAFGPGGTLAKLSQTEDVYLITVTGGQAGMCNLDVHGQKLEEIRREELMNSAKILGIKKVYFLGFEDGTLSNNKYHEIASKIGKILKKLHPNILLTFEPKGVSGHIDHITVSMITTFLFKKNKSIKTLMYYCIMEKRREKYLDDYFIYFPEGYPEKQIDHVVDTTDTINKKMEAIKTHASQMEDGLRVIKSLKRMPPKEYFLIKKQ